MAEDADIGRILLEDDARTESRFGFWDPLTGEGSPGERVEVVVGDLTPSRMFLPKAMADVDLVRGLAKDGSVEAFCMRKFGFYESGVRERVVRRFVRLRCKHDFPFLAYAFMRIKNKMGGENVRFLLNYPQRYLLGVMEEMRLSGVPIRVVILKARQWGGSTLVEMYIAWIQLFWKEGWYSSIVAQDASTSRKIRAMYVKMLDCMPAWLLGYDEEERLCFAPYNGSQLDSIVSLGGGRKAARDTVITVGTYNNPSAGRGGDISCAHMSEVGFWEDTDGKTPEDVIRSISSSLPMAALSVEAIESTANGMNFFCDLYTDAKAGRSSRRAVFVPWFYIHLYRRHIDDRESFVRFLLDNKDNPNPSEDMADAGTYYWYLWRIGATLEGIAWYMEKRKDYRTHMAMQAEFPSDDVEAFVSSEKRAFDPYFLEELRGGCMPAARVGELVGLATKGKRSLEGVRFVDGTHGCFRVWSEPDAEVKVSRRYLVVVDIGGESDGADFSDILVIDRYWMMYGGRPEVVAEWHGHVAHSVLAWMSVRIAHWYCDALLVIESNTIESKDNDTDGDQSEFLFNQIGRVYKRLYRRKPSAEDVKQGVKGKYGFHTNARTKPVVVQNLKECVSGCSYVEREEEAVDEMAVYTKVGNGKYEAKKGFHDDRVMTRAIGLYVCLNEMELPVLVVSRE